MVSWMGLKCLGVGLLRGLDREAFASFFVDFCPIVSSMKKNEFIIIKY